MLVHDSSSTARVLLAAACLSLLLGIGTGPALADSAVDVQIRVRINVPATAIVDNTDALAWKKYEELSGNWRRRKRPSDCYGTNYTWTKTEAGAETARARWSCTSLAAGNYEVYAWWPASRFQSTSVPYVVMNGSSSLATVLVDQTANGGQWNLLGVYGFDAGGHGVEIHNGQTRQSKQDRRLCADAVKFVRVESAQTLESTDPMSETYDWEEAGGIIVPATAPIDGGTGTDALPSCDGIVDNRDSTWQKSCKRLSGSWSLSTGVGAYYGRDYAYTNAKLDDETARARFICRGLSAGRYGVYAWWSATSNRATRVAYEIHHAKGVTTVRLDQTKNGGQWNLLGTYDFDASSHVVEIHNGQSTPGKFVCADAVRFVRVPPP